VSNLIVPVCTRCGSNLPSTAYSFCPTCGADISQRNRNRLKWTSDFLGNTFKAITHSSSSMSINMIKNIADGIDDDIEKVPIRSILKRVADSTSDPRVVEIAKSLAKHSPKIAISIAAAALTFYGIPVAPLLTPLAAVTAKQIKTTSATVGDSSSSDNLDLVEYAPLITKAIEKIAEQQKRSG
jgi:predicted RNA-binding Zn-ribbon protein involved in translation (DUF1610 family)